MVPTIWLSATGRDWEPVRSPFPALADERSIVSRLVVFQGRLYAVGAEVDQLRVWSSPDGERWSPVDVGGAPGARGPATPPGERIAVVGAAATEDRMIILAGPWSGDGGSDLVVASTDGTTWSRSIPTGLAGPIEDLTIGQAGFLLRRCLCSQPDEQWWLMASRDGTTWVEAGELPSHASGIAFDDARQRYLAATLDIHEDGRSYAALDASGDGVAWERIVTAPGGLTGQVEVAVTGDTILMLVGDSAVEDPRSLVMASHDAGATWTLSPLPRAREAECVIRTVIGASTIVAVGDCEGRLAWSARR
jgi:hypothetical protein